MKHNKITVSLFSVCENIRSIISSHLQIRGFIVDNLQSVDSVSIDNLINCDICIVNTDNITTDIVSEFLEKEPTCNPDNKFIILTSRPFPDIDLTNPKSKNFEFISVPFSFCDIDNAINRLLKQSYKNNERQLFYIGNITFDVSEGRLKVGSYSNDLNPIETQILKHICCSANRPAYISEINTSIYGYDNVLSKSYLDFYIKRINSFLKAMGSASIIAKFNGKVSLVNQQE